MITHDAYYLLLPFKSCPSIKRISFRCTNGDFYVALGSSMGFALLVWVGGLLKQVLYFFSNDPSLGQKSPIMHLPQQLTIHAVVNTSR